MIDSFLNLIKIFLHSCAHLLFIQPLLTLLALLLSLYLSCLRQHTHTQTLSSGTSVNSRQGENISWSSQTEMTERQQRYLQLFTCVHRLLPSCLCSGSEGVSSSEHQRDRLHPCHSDPSHQSGERGGAEGTDQRAGTKPGALCETIRTKKPILPLSNTSEACLSSIRRFLSVCVYLSGWLCYRSSGEGCVRATVSLDPVAGQQSPGQDQTPGSLISGNPRHCRLWDLWGIDTMITDEPEIKKLLRVFEIWQDEY